MEIKNGATFHAYIQENCCEENTNKSFSETPCETNLVEEYNNVSNNNEQAIITISPNPFKNVISIGFFLESDESVEINLYDTKGLFVKQLMYNSLMQHGEHSYTFNLSELKQGIYLLTLKTSHGDFRNLKIEKI